MASRTSAGCLYSAWGFVCTPFNLCMWSWGARDRGSVMGCSIGKWRTMSRCGSLGGSCCRLGIVLLPSLGRTFVGRFSKCSLKGLGTQRCMLGTSWNPSK